ncbi:MAG: hypothetical protein ACLFTK_01430 [Anaerolineales bacterium]
MIDLGATYQDFRDAWADDARRLTLIEAYTGGDWSFIPNLLPEQAIHLTGDEALSILRARLGDVLDLALHPDFTDPGKLPAEWPAALASPVADRPDGTWLQSTHMVGINVRTVRTFWNVVKYMLVIPAAQDSVHLLPIWEPGVVDSLYGISSWQINDEFFSPEWAGLVPHLDSVERQLKATVNILHTLGKAVGMDVIPHTDRFSEMALAQPHYFEWLQRQDTQIINHREHLHENVQARLFAFLTAHGAAVPGLDMPPDARALFYDLDEAARGHLLFGLPADRAGRNIRRGQLVKHLHRYGYEPVPATMAPPFRGIKVNLDESEKHVDSEGLVWRNYEITEPQLMSRVFNPLARFKFYGRLDDNQNWAIDFDAPRVEVWDYFCGHYRDIQQRYGFSFMRGDMSHVQMRPQGVPQTVDRYYDVLGAVKLAVRAGGAPYFGYFAETFLPARDIFGYGEEIDHLEASGADTTLGDLQSTTVGTSEFIQRLRQYDDLRQTRRCIPSFTMMTADKDDPRFDEFYIAGNELRYFMAMFLDFPSYMALGFQTRDVHHAPVANERYTKLFVFHETSGSKGRAGLDFIWGRNGHLYSRLTRLKRYAETLLPNLDKRALRWLIPPDALAWRKTLAWAVGDIVFVGNMDLDAPAAYFGIPLEAPDGAALVCEFSTHGDVPAPDQILQHNGYFFRLAGLAPGEGRVYRRQEF